MNPRRDFDDEQFLMDMIVSGTGTAAHVQESDGDEQAGDGSNTDMYLNMSGDYDAEQEANVYIITAILLFKTYL